jgi:hypothetical protein
MTAAALALGVLLGAPAQAHITLTYPTARAGQTSPVGFPCGLDPDPGRLTPTPLLPGSTIEVRWTEWINHPGHFRISFDDNGQDDFVDPLSYTNFYTVPSVLLDDIADPVGVTQHSAVVTLPFIECDNCTLQLMQVLTDKPPYTAGSTSDDLHRMCADLTLTLNAETVFANGFEGP